MEWQVNEIEQAQPVSGLVKAQRYFSLDVFRGMSVCLMIIVNTPGKGAPLYPFLVHAKWLGFTLADLVFPSFLFAVGNSMSFSLRMHDTTLQGDFLTKVIRRGVIIFLIGYLLYWFPFFTISPDGAWQIKPVSETRIMGVLQRIALCYLAASIVIYYVSQRNAMIISAVLLLMYWLVLYLFGDDGKAMTIDGNAITRLDVFLLGEGHIYKKDVVAFDPEGILSTFPAIVNVMAGYWVGVFVQKKGNTNEGMLRILLIGCCAVAVALGWHLLFPISKKLWTSSFVLLTIGIDMLWLAILIYWIEFRHRRFGTHFFDVFGKNPLFIYLLSEILYIILTLVPVAPGYSVFEWISIEVFQKILPGPVGALTTAVVFMLICWYAGWVLHKRKIYIRI
jgi:predicted acyltransferase